MSLGQFSLTKLEIPDIMELLKQQKQGEILISFATVDGQNTAKITILVLHILLIY